MALTLGVAAASSHVISDQYIDVEPDGYWTAEVAAGGHQQWNFDLVEQRNHNTVIEIVEPADANSLPKRRVSKMLANTNAKAPSFYRGP